MLTEIYVNVDDFCQENADLIRTIFRNTGILNKDHPSNLTLSEVMTILIYYHIMPYKNFKKYYTEYVAKDLKQDFPDLVSYNRFCELIPRAFFVLIFYLIYRCSLSQKTGIYYIDSTKWMVCHPKRAHFHKVMKGFADWGKSSMGWFFGLKVHLIINQFGELINVFVSKGSTADNNITLLHRLTHDLWGWIFGDRGYLLNPLKKEALERQGELRFFAKWRKNMKKQDIPFEAQSWLGKRNIVETVIGIAKIQCDITHSRHRSPSNAFANLLAGLCAYTFMERKPCATVNLERRMLPKQAIELLNAA